MFLLLTKNNERKRMKETFGEKGGVHSIGCGEAFTGVMSPRSPSCICEICSGLHINHINWHLNKLLFIFDPQWGDFSKKKCRPD